MPSPELGRGHATARVHYASRRRSGVDNADCAALLHLELSSDHVAELFLSVVCYSNGSDTVLDDDILVILAVSNLHEGCWTFACAVRTARGPNRVREVFPHKQLEAR